MIEPDPEKLPVMPQEFDDVSALRRALHSFDFIAEDPLVSGKDPAELEAMLRKRVWLG